MLCRDRRRAAAGKVMFSYSWQAGASASAQFAQYMQRHSLPRKLPNGQADASWVDQHTQSLLSLQAGLRHTSSDGTPSEA